MVGKYGDIIFETSDRPGQRKVTFKMSFSAMLGVRPREMLEKLVGMVEKGKVDYLVIGGKAVGENRFAITDMGETWDTVYSRGELARASVTVTLKEYV